LAGKGIRMARRSVWRRFALAVFVAVCFLRPLGAQDTAMREAFAAFTRGDLPGAERLFRQIVDREPTNRIARFYLGNAIYYQHNYQPAIEVYAPLVEEELKDPQLARLMQDAEVPLALIDNLAMAYGISGQYEKCLATLDKGLALAPDYPSFHFNRACFYAEMGGKEEEALASTEQALRKAMRTLSLEEMVGLVRKDDSLQKLTRPGDLSRLLEHYTLPRRTVARESSGQVTVSLNHERLKVTLLVPDCTEWRSLNEKNPRQVLALHADKGNIHLTLWSEFVGPGATPQQCREHYLARIKETPFFKAGSVKLEEHPTFALAIHDAAPAGAPAEFFSRSYNAYFVSGEYCLDLHLSAGKPDEATEAKMRAIIESLKVEPLPPLPTLFLKEEPKPAPQPAMAP
jgi:tetratricopeptide (TPR) repeat protein